MQPGEVVMFTGACVAVVGFLIMATTQLENPSASGNSGLSVKTSAGDLSPTAIYRGRLVIIEGNTWRYLGDGETIIEN